jgi:tRNA dimethylallyltransferase
MDIGTAKVSRNDRLVPYHLLDLLNPGEPFSAALYQNFAREAIDDIIARGKVPVVCGGTGLYVRAALDTMEFPAGEQSANPLRERYQALVDEQGSLALHALLAQRDPESARLIHPHNVRRVIRALELFEGGETTYALQHEGLLHLTEMYRTRYLGIEVEVPVLSKRIDARVEGMFEEGLLAEVLELMLHGFTDALTAPQAIGYKELVPLLLPLFEGSLSKTSKPDILERIGRSLDGPGLSPLMGVCNPDALKQAKEDIKQATRHYAKRQRTWFRGDARITWLPVRGKGRAAEDALLLQALDLLR